MNIDGRLRRLEDAAGLTGTGCPDCAGRERTCVRTPGEADPEPVACPRCGRDLLTVIRIVFVKQPVPKWAEK